MLHLFLFIFSTDIVIPIFLSEPQPEPIIDRYIWIRYDQDNTELFLTLKSDGTVVLSKKGKYKITDPNKPSSSIRQMANKYIISLEDQPICSNGYDKPMSICTKSRGKKYSWEFIETEYGTMIESSGLCMTKSNALYEGGDELGEYGVLTLPCDSSVEQMFTVVLTDTTNWEKY